MAVIHLANPAKNIRNCSVAVVGNPPTGQTTTDFRTLQTICQDTVANTTSVRNTFDTRYDGRFTTQTVILDGGGA